MNAPRDFKCSAFQNKFCRRRVAKTKMGERHADEVSVMKGVARTFAVRWVGNTSLWLLVVLALAYISAKPGVALIGFTPIMIVLLLQWFALAVNPRLTQVARPIPITDTHDTRARFGQDHRSNRAKGFRVVDYRDRYSHRDGESE